MEDNRGLLAHWSFDEEEGKYATDAATGIEDKIEYVFNEVRYMDSQDPLRKKGVSGNALLFDGYSTWISRPVEKLTRSLDALTIEAWVAPRSFEKGIDSRLSPIVNQHNREMKEGYIFGIFRHGTWSLQLGLNGEWVEVWAEGHPIPLNQWSYLVATYDRRDCVIKLYLNGQEVTAKYIASDAPITPSGADFLIGKNNQGVVLGDTPYTLNMYSGLIDELKIFGRALSPEEVGQAFLDYVAPHGGTIPALPYDDIKLDRGVLKNDRHHPQYHLSPPQHWMNEPHAPIYFNGQYHLFYQHDPHGPYMHTIHWGHWVSDDLAHWRDLPFALAPEDNGLDPDGDWSGSAVYDENGIPALFFTAGNDSEVPNQRVGLARSTFPKDGDNDLVHWEKHPVPVIVQEKGQGMFGDFRDPFVWKEGNIWYLLIGSGTDGQGGTALAYTSGNMIDWDYKGPFYISDPEKYPYLGNMWELPVFLPLGKDNSGKEKHILLISPLGPEADVEVFYWIGTFDREAMRFIPDVNEPQLIDVGDFHFTGPSGMVDPKTGRKLIFTISQGVRTAQINYDAGYAHNAGIPVSIFLREDGRLGVRPIEELEQLRGEKMISIQNKAIDQANDLLINVKGDMLEIRLELESGTSDCWGIKFRRSPGGEEETLIYYNMMESALKVNRNKSSLDDLADWDRGIQGGRLDLNGENLKLHMYLDRSMVEVYANELKSLTTRVYPSRPDALGLQILGDVSVTVKSMEVWAMKPAF
ncbi:GH32 C-terminal domain-containing protein [Paenibacillus sp. Soil522]|uniref:GH32 C-terminal domain-containing protein n=1 Tax=Paenibacillus sp. Soil522 TaxID=1736388 RepID=UPI0006F43B4D|nr:GH32 C-terminal domain-containing protein [Paenibacillus sp. Soil522]KRE47085.1 glycoside hydrolase [Paenibacillus sp. Soil522]